MEKIIKMKKVGVVNRTTLLNFGSVLQVLALTKAIERFGYDVDVIWEEGSVSKNIDLRPLKIISIVLKLLRYPQFIKNSFKDLRSVQKLNMEKSQKICSRILLSGISNDVFSLIHKCQR